MSANQSPTAGCSVKPAIEARPRSVAVNGTVIPRDAIARETQNHTASSPIDAWRKAARALAIRELLLQEGRRLAVPAEPLTDEEGRRETEEEALVRALIDRAVATPVADEAACRRFFEANRARFASGSTYVVAHILLPAAPADAAARAAAESRAASIIETLRREPERFAALALEFSACPSRDNGGSLGEISSGDTVSEFEAVLKRAEVGKVHPAPVRSRYGVHVVRLDRRAEGKPLPYEAVADRIADYLAESVERRALSQYIAVLAARATIVGVDLTPADANLMH